MIAPVFSHEGVTTGTTGTTEMADLANLWSVSMLCLCACVRRIISVDDTIKINKTTWRARVELALMISVPSCGAVCTEVPRFVDKATQTSFSLGTVAANHHHLDRSNKRVLTFVAACSFI
jgi:hypothetical protein